MAVSIATDWKVVVNNVNLSDHAFGVEGADEKERIDVSTFSPTGARSFLPGLREQVVTVSFLMDRAGSSVYATIKPLYEGGSAFPFFVQADSDAGTSATNPIFGGTASVFSFPFGAELNSREEVEIAFAPASNSVFAYGTVAP